MQNYKLNLTSLLAALIACAVIWSAFQTASDSMTQAYWYQLTPDEALHTEVVEVLSQTGKYSNWGGRAFVPALTTGPTLIVPAAILTKIGISSARAARAVCFLYYLGTLALLLLLLKDALAEFAASHRIPFVLAGAIAIGLYHMGYRGLHDTGYYTFGVMGEGAGAFFLLLCAYLYEREEVFWGGAAATLAVLSKPFMIFLPLVFAATVIWEHLNTRKPNKTPEIKVSRRHVMIQAGTRAPPPQYPVFLSAMGLLLPALIWVGWTIGVLGWGGAMDFWITYPSVMRSVNGAGLPQSDLLNIPGVFNIVLGHLAALSGLFKVRSLVIIVAGLALALLSSRHRSSFRLLFAFSVVHLAWWFALSPGAQARYIFPAVTAGWICFAVLGTALLALKLPKWEMDARWISYALGLTSIYFSWGVYGEWKENADDFDSCSLCRQIKVQEYWKAHAGEFSGGQGPPVVYTTSQNYGKDLDLVLSAPAQLVSGIPGKQKGLFLMGEEPTSEAVVAFNSTAGCLPKFVLSKRAIGIWECR